MRKHEADLTYLTTQAVISAVVSRLIALK